MNVTSLLSRFTVERYARGERLGDDISHLLVAVFVGERFSPRRGIPNFDSAALTGRGTAWIARSSARGEAIGTLFLVEPGGPFSQIATADELELHLMAVRPSARRQGVADALMARCLEEARQTEALRLVLSTQPEMCAAQALYAKHGFTRVSGRDWQRSDGRSFLAYQLNLKP